MRASPGTDAADRRRHRWGLRLRLYQREGQGEMIRGCAAAAVLLLAAGAKLAAADDDFAVTLQADRTDVQVADPLWVTVSATAPAGWSIALPDAPDAFQELRVTTTITHLHHSDTGERTATRRLQLESLLPGRYQVGPLDVLFLPTTHNSDAGANGGATPVRRATESVTIGVRSTLGFAQGQRLRDIYGTVRTPWAWWQWIVAAAATVSAVAVGRIVYSGVASWLRRRRISQRSLLHQLDRLDEARLNRSLSPDRLIVSVADVVRQSLRLAEGARPVYRTTDEWIQRLEKGNGESSLLADAVKVVLLEADAVKFAGGTASVDQARRCLDAARTIVRFALREDPRREQGGVRA